MYQPQRHFLISHEVVPHKSRLRADQNYSDVIMHKCYCLLYRQLVVIYHIYLYKQHCVACLNHYFLFSALFVTTLTTYLYVSLFFILTFICLCTLFCSKLIHIDCKIGRRVYLQKFTLFIASLREPIFRFLWSLS